MREKLIELIGSAYEAERERCFVCFDDDVCIPDGYCDAWLAGIADYLIAHGVTIAKDNNVLSKKPSTNGDRIRAMSDEELIPALLAVSYCDDIYECDNCIWDTSPFCTAHIASKNEIYGWLKQPVKEGT